MEELTNKRRDKKTTLARHIAIYLLREGYSCSLSEIGKELGNRNHATVLHAYEKIASALSTNQHLSDQVAEIRERLSPQRGHSKTHRNV